MFRKPLKPKESGRVQAATDSTAKPGNFKLGSLESRAAARAILEAKAQRPKKERWMVEVIGVQLDLERSTCRRWLGSDGGLFEMVTLHGRSEDLSEEQLEEFINRFPIEGAKGAEGSVR